MLFNSYEFLLVYLPIVFIVYFWFGRKSDTWARIWMVAASFFFYGWWDYQYVPLLLASITFNYFVGCRLEETSRSKTWLCFGITVNFILLGIYKYTGFFLQNVNDLMGAAFFNVPEIVLPLGISFFTFTQTAYLIDAYRGETKNGSFLAYCEFVTVFPHLIAGPIINHRKMIPQFLTKENFCINYDNIAYGLTLISFGLFKKVIIADRIAEYVNNIFAQPDNLTLPEAWIGAVGYTLQLYFDFSGYSEVAVGLARMFNLHFPVNFDSPYRSLSIIDFWRRWHMTLGAWVRDYLYIPLGGNRQGELRKMFNLLVSMLLIGLWHGARWTFVIWGGIHGVLLLINHEWRRLEVQIPKPFCWGITFLAVTLAWVFFRASDNTAACQIIRTMFDVSAFQLPNSRFCIEHQAFFESLGISLKPLSYMADTEIGDHGSMLLGLLVLVGFCPNPIRLMEKFSTNKRWLVVAILLFISSLVYMNSYTEFLYFQF